MIFVTIREATSLNDYHFNSYQQQNDMSILIKITNIGVCHHPTSHTIYSYKILVLELSNNDFMLNMQISLNNRNC